MIEKIIVMIGILHVNWCVVITGYLVESQNTWIIIVLQNSVHENAFAKFIHLTSSITIWLKSLGHGGAENNM